MIEMQYESKFDGFLVDLRIGPAEELNNAMFGGEEVFTYKRGSTVSSNLLPAETFGCLIWIERFDGSPESIATLFHELVHASTVRFEKSGVLRRAPKRKDVRSELVSFDELVANSVSELGTAFLGAWRLRRTETTIPTSTGERNEKRVYRQESEKAQVLEAKT